MAWWQHFAGERTDAASLRFPLEFHVVPGTLVVTIDAHDFLLDGANISCWSYTSSGLAYWGQREMVVTLVRQANQAMSDFPQAPLEFLKIALNHAMTGEFVESGSISEFGPSGFLTSRVRGAGYLDAQRLGSWMPPEDGLSLLFLTEDEMAAARVAGLTRIAACLGMKERTFPCPVWNDLAREPALDAASVALMKESFLCDIPRFHVLGASATMKDETITLRLPASSRPHLEQLLDLPGDVPAAILTGIDRECGSILVWQPDQEAQPLAISSPGSAGSGLSGCFIGFVPDQERDFAVIKDDGFVVSLTSSTWQALRRALTSAYDFSIDPPGQGLGLDLTWYDDETVRTRRRETAREMLGSARDSERTAAGKLQPSVIREITLLTPEADLSGRVDVEHLSRFIEHLGDLIANHFGEIGQQDGFDLFVECGLRAGEEPSFLLRSRPVIDAWDSELLEDRLSLVFPPAVETESVSFLLELSIWGGASPGERSHDGN